MKVLFIGRSDLFQTPGGDFTQMMNTKANLEKMGVRVDVTTDMLPDASGYDVAHIFQITQDTSLKAMQAGYLNGIGVPVAVSTIFWTFEELYWGQMAVREAFHYKKWDILDQVENRTYKGGPLKPPFSQAYLDSVRAVIDRADIVLPNSNAEGRRLEDYTGLRFNWQKVVNGVEYDEIMKYKDAPSIPKHDDFALVAGRWDDVKNLLMLCKALEGLGIPMVFAGAHTDPMMERLIMEVIPKNSMIFPNLPQGQLFPLMWQAKAAFQPSWHETTGLTSLEAATCGCQIVVGNTAAQPEYFGDSAAYCDPASVKSIRAAVEKAWSGSLDIEPLRHKIKEEYTWMRAAEQTLHAYKKIAR